jgi:hypothetical protein
MTFSQLIPYLGFVIASLLAHVAWTRWLAGWGRCRQLVPELLLNGRERFELEQITTLALQKRIAHDQPGQQRLVSTYLQTVPNFIVPNFSDTLVQHIRHDSETVNRFVFNCIRSLDDSSLIQIAVLLDCPISESRKLNQHSLSRPWRQSGWPCPQKITACFGLGVFTFMLLAPPWLAQLHRQTQVVGGGRTTQLLEQSSIGYRWIGADAVPAPQITVRPTNDLRRFEQDVYQWRINYVRLLAQLVVCTLATSVAFRGPRRTLRESHAAKTDRRQAVCSKPLVASG